MVQRGPQAWMAAVITIVMLIMTAAAFYAIWNVFQVGDGVGMLKWGGLAWLLLTMVSFIKVWFWTHGG